MHIALRSIQNIFQTPFVRSFTLSELVQQVSQHRAEFEVFCTSVWVLLLDGLLSCSLQSHTTDVRINTRPQHDAGCRPHRQQQADTQEGIL